MKKIAVTFFCLVSLVLFVSQDNIINQVQNQAPANQYETYGPDGGTGYLETDPEIPVESFRLADGRKGWKVKLLGNFPLASPAVVDGKVYIGGGFGSYEFYSIDSVSGKVLWLFHCGDDGPTAAVVEKGRVAFNTESCVLYVLDAQTGESIWSEWLGDPLMSQPAMDGSRIVMVFPNNRGEHSIVCMDAATGKHLWEKDIVGEVISAPVIDSGMVYASTLEGSVHCYNLADGRLLFSREHQATSAPWIYKGEIYVSLREDEPAAGGNGVSIRSEGQGRIKDSGERDNAELWGKQAADYLNVDEASSYAEAQSELDSAVGFASAPPSAKLYQSAGNLGVQNVSGVWFYEGSRPTVIDGISYSSMGNNIKAMKAETGEIIWEKELKTKDENSGARLFSPPAWASGKLYITSVSGELVCLDASSGSELWRYDCGEPVHFQPAVVNGRIYMGTDSGSVVCIEAKDKNAGGWAMWGGNARHNGISD